MSLARPWSAPRGEPAPPPAPTATPQAAPENVDAAPVDHAARRALRVRAMDRPLLAAIVLLLLIGVMVVFSASTPFAIDLYGSATYILKRQLVWLLLGLSAAAFATVLDPKVLQRWSVVLLLGSLGLLVITLPFGITSNGSQRWLAESGGGGSIQPSEAAKLSLIIFLADWLSSKREQVRDLTMGLIPFSMIIGVVCGLIVLERHLSTALLIAFIALWMFFTAGAHLGQLVAVGGLAAVFGTLLVVFSEFRMRRIAGFLHPEEDRLGDGYQLYQSLRSFSAGGLSGVGMGQGAIKHSLPTAHTDAIFAVIGEEFGLLGCAVVMALFAVVVWRGLRIAAGSRDRFSCLLATGLSCWIASQAILNMAVATGSIPPTGISLPYISYGGSNLITMLFGTGILLSLSRRSETNRSKLYDHLDLRRGQRRARLSRAHRHRRLGP